MGEGKVIIVGAGPGSPDLITLRGIRALRAADVVFYDSLVGRDLLKEVGKGTQTVYVGKEPGGRGWKQEEIDHAVLEAAAEGKTVVRLKGGDPGIFGRLAEEVSSLENHGVPFEVIPGLTSATAVATALGLPLTSRGRSRSVAVATARTAGGEVVPEFPKAHTLVILMGTSELPTVVERLLEGGWAGVTPACMIERGTLPYEKVVEGTLGEIAPLSRNNEMSSPAILIVGSTVGELRHRPVVLFTGIEPESFRHLGRLIHWPAIEVKEIQTPETDSIFGELDRQTFSHIVLTSRVGARIVLKQLWDSGRDLRVLAGTRLIVSGEGTARELTERGLRPDFPHDNSGGEGIVRVLSERGERGKLLLVQGQQARDFLQEGLESMGFDVRKVAFHSVVPHPQLGKALPSHDVVYFTSPSGAKAFHQVYGRQGFRGESWCIGKATLRALKAIGIQGKVVSPYVSTNQNAAVEAY